jgi:hypothetical protein
MRWSRRPATVAVTEPEPAPPVAVAEDVDVMCDRMGCGRLGAAPCRYVDRRGQRCATAWCASHRLVVGPRAYCLRHGNLMAAIMREALVAAPLPDVDNRAPSLLISTCDHLGAAIIRMLGEHRTPGWEVTELPVHLTFVGAARERTWARRWALASHVGVALAVALVVDEAEPTRVRATVDGTTVLTAQPLAGVRSGTEPAARLARFGDTVVAALLRGVDQRMSVTAAHSDAALLAAGH